VNFKRGEDGVFWMSFEEFKEYYSDLSVAYYKDDFVFSNIL